MSAGTIKLTNASTAVVGTGTTFTTDLKSGDVITTTISGVFYTLFVDTVTSATAATLADAFTGPTTTGAAYVAVPAQTLSKVPAQLAIQTSEAVRRVLQENVNWQAFYSGTGDITITLPNGTSTGLPLTGPSWAKLSSVANSSWIDRGQLSTSANLNTMSPADTEGEWSKSSGTGLTTANGFPVGAGIGTLKVNNGGRYQGQQVYIDYTANQWVRTLTSTWNGTDGPWSDWINTGKTSLRTTTLAAAANLNTYNGRDLDGMYRVNVTTATMAANGVPYDSFRGWIVCQQGIAESDRTSQIAYSNTGNVFTRYVSGTWNGTDGPWSDWREIGVTQRSNQESGDLNLIATNGVYPTLYSAATSVNWPVAAHGFMRVSARANAVGTIVQEFYTTQSTGSYITRRYIRAYSGGTWSPWVEEVNTGSIASTLGSVMGIGLPSQVPVDAFDWQQADFVAGQKILVNVSTWVNPPTGLGYVSGDVVDIECVLCRTNANRYVVKLSSQATGAGNRSDFRVVIYNAKGSRAFGVDQIFTSNNPVPVTAGGTGATTAAAARTALDVFATGEIGPEFINGLDLSVDAVGGTITCSVGAAYIPANGIVRVTAPITVAPAGLVAATWRHVYLYMNGTTPAIEAVTTDPMDYAYPAKQKTGANTRRYLGSFRVGSSLTLSRQICINGRCYFTETFSTSYRIVSSGMSTAKANAVTNIAAPATATMLELHVSNASTTSAAVEIASKPGAGYGGAIVQNGNKVMLQVPNDGYPYITYQYLSTPATNGVFIDIGGYSYAR